MYAANQRMSVNEFTSGRMMNALPPIDLIKVAEIFGVVPDNVRVVDHPLVAERLAVAITFDRGGNVADAVSSYLNHEFYEVGSELAAEFIFRDPNLYSFVDDVDFGTALFLTIPSNPRDFLERLSQHRQELRFVALHPQILFMMRPRMPYETAKSTLKKGFELLL